MVEARGRAMILTRITIRKIYKKKSERKERENIIEKAIPRTTPNDLKVITGLQNR